MNDNINRVSLKPIYNIKPQIYIPIFYLFVFIIIISSLFIFPGLKDRGSYINITSSPLGASVYIDETRVGSTPLEVFVTNGYKKITLKKDNFNNKEINIDIKGKIFFTLFKKDIQNHHVIMDSNNGLSILDNSYQDASEWSLIDSSQINSRYRIPPILSEAVSDYFYSSDFNKSVLNNYLYSSVKLITSEYILSDYIKAILISTSDNRLPSVSSMQKTALLINKIVSERKNTPLLLYNRILQNSEIKMNNDLYQKLNENHRKLINKNVTSFDEPERDINLGNLKFKNVPQSNIIPMGVNFIHGIQEDSFYILESLLSKENYLEFLDDNPVWKKINLNNLIADGLVDKYYLDFSNDEDYITNISYFAANAWCKWANERYNVPEGWVITLPSENRWFSALQFNVIKDNVAWQWTTNGFFLYDHYLTDSYGSYIESFTDITPRVVVGNNKYNTKAESGRGVQNSDWCTPFIGFRPVLIKE